MTSVDIRETNQKCHFRAWFSPRPEAIPKNLQRVQALEGGYLTTPENLEANHGLAAAQNALEHLCGTPIFTT